MKRGLRLVQTGIIHLKKVGTETQCSVQLNCDVQCCVIMHSPHLALLRFALFCSILFFYSAVVDFGMATLMHTTREAPYETGTDPPFP
jgi:hypothetical protein